MPLGRYYSRIVTSHPLSADESKQILPDYPVAHWKLENLNDSRFNGLTLTNNNSATFKRGKFNNCVKLDGVNQYLSRATTTIIGFGLTNFFIICNIRGFKGTGTKTIYQKFDSGNKGYKLEINAATGIITASLGASAVATVSSTLDVLDGKWHSLLVVVDRASQIAIYVDNRNNKTTSSLTTIIGSIANTQAFHIGASRVPDQYFAGEVDEVRMYEAYLPTNTEIDNMLEIAPQYVVGTEDRGGILDLQNQEQSRLSLNITGKDQKWRQRYVVGSQICLLHDLVALDNILSIWNLQNTLDDEAINGNNLVKQAGTDSYITGGGLNFDGTVWYKVVDAETLTPKSLLTINGKLALIAFTGTVRTILAKGTSNQAFYIFAASGTNDVTFRLRIGGVNYDKTYAFTPGTAFDYAITYDGSNVRLYINGTINGSPTAATGVFSNDHSDVGFGALSDGTQKLQTGDKVHRLKMWERALSATEVSDLYTLTTPTLNCLFDGIILTRPMSRDTKLDFSLESKDYLHDRLVNEDLTMQFAGSHKLGDIMRKSVQATSLTTDFVNISTNVEDTEIASEGKYFVRTPMIDVFRWIADTCHSVYYSQRRGTNRYLFHHIVQKKHSGLTLTGANLVLDQAYRFSDDLLKSSNTIEVEGGSIKTIEEQQTFDNGTSKNSNGKWYYIKSTPEFIRYGQINLKMKKTGSPPDLHIEVREDKAGNPAGPEAITLASVTLPATDVHITTSMALVPIDFEATLKTGSTYWIAIFPAGDGSNFYSFADNGGVSDTNMKDSTDDSTFNAVGYTFVYNLKRNDPVLTTVKNSDDVSTYKVRKLRFTDSTITDKATARQIARGLLEKLSKVQMFIEDLYIKDITLIPQIGQMCKLVDAYPSINEDFTVQALRITLPPGKGNFFDHMTISIGDRAETAEKMFRELVSDYRRTVEAVQQVTADTLSWGESQEIGIRVIGMFVAPVNVDQRIGFRALIVGGEPARSLPKTDMLWDTDDIGGFDPDNKYEDGMMDSDDFP